ncbi:argininosuccinate lyase [Paraburkholderia strydomiana]|uniref:Argininosuccinate lyase n=1 Tax=Paraburkholderia strydomiana TaxID=1245417 RepID=A0ABW9ESU3_9BURK
MAAIGATAHFDYRLARYDVQCSQAHVMMLLKQQIIEDADAQRLMEGLEALREKIEDEAFHVNAEDVHTALEQQLEELVGPVAGNIGMARARNDLAVTSLKLWLRESIDSLIEQLASVLNAFCEQARSHAATVMPGFSHLQAGQPITFGHLCLAYGETLFRDVERLHSARAALRECPLGSGAIAGTAFPIDRDYSAQLLGFDRPSANSVDSVGERSFALDFLAASASLALSLSRFAAEIVFWSSQPVGFIHLPDVLVTGSAAMPHKRNPDAAELVRAKCGRVLGNQQQLQTVVKGLPLSYFRDLQEDKEALFDTADSLHLMLDATLSIVTLMEPQIDTMARAASVDFLTSSDLADWLTQTHQIPFREAHGVVVRLVKAAEQEGRSLSDLSPQTRAAIDARIATGDWPSIDAEDSVRSRTSFGGTAPAQVARAADRFASRLAALRRLSKRIANNQICISAL